MYIRRRRHREIRQTPWAWQFTATQGATYESQILAIAMRVVLMEALAFGSQDGDRSVSLMTRLRVRGARTTRERFPERRWANADASYLQELLDAVDARITALEVLAGLAPASALAPADFSGGLMANQLMANQSSTSFDAATEDAITGQIESLTNRIKLCELEARE